LLLLAAALLCVYAADDLVRVSDAKAFKKLLKQKSNVFVIYSNGVPDKKQLAEYTDLASKIRGKGTLALVDCNNKASKKLCEDIEKDRTIKYYKEGEFVTDYKRPLKPKSIESFISNPNADGPWEEDEAAKDVLHLTDDTYDQTIAQKKPTLVMFYAPWCGHCKVLKPDYAAAATELKGKAILAAIDANAHTGRRAAAMNNITGFPTLKYYENGEFKFEFGGQRSKQGIIDFMNNPAPPAPPPPPEPAWSETPSDVNHLTAESFDDFLATHNSTLVMFYAPWCGHCKAAKPEYTSAAKILKDENIDGVLAAVDADQHSELGKRFGVTGYPTIIYFKDGKEAFKYTEGRKEKDFVSFMKDPKEPPPPPPPEPAWSETSSDVVHLTAENFNKVVKAKKSHVLVMFYAPWCGHCKKAKPEYVEAAAALAENKKIKMAAIDCTVHGSICSEHDVKGYPTIKYFANGKYVAEYDATRTKDGFVEYLTGKAGNVKTEL